jgi:hypothetical protein
MLPEQRRRVVYPAHGWIPHRLGRQRAVALQALYAAISDFDGRIGLNRAPRL